MFKKIILTTLVSLSIAFPVAARDYVFAVGSSTVFPFAAAVAEQVARNSDFRAPLVESWGTGGGVKLFCQGIGADEADVALASREITEDELAQCAANGVGEILKLRFGSDGITIVTGKDLSLQLTLRMLYLALAKQVPGPGVASTELIANPYQRWSEVDSRLPDLPIKVYGPPLTSGTRDLLVQQGLTPGCRTFAAVKALEEADPNAFRAACGVIREDGAYVTTGEHDNLIVRRVATSDHAVGVLGFSYYDQNQDLLQAAAVENILPSFESIHDGTYPLARPLFVYVKQAHLNQIPGLSSFLKEFISAKAVGEEGYLVDHGLVPIPEDERASNLRLLEQAAKN